MTPGPRPLVLVKLGGSLLTDKRRAAHARSAEIARLAQEIATVQGLIEEKLILGHGSGSFGHVAAAQFGLGQAQASGQPSPPDPVGVSSTQDAAATLHRQIISALRSAGTKPFSLVPSSFLTARAGRPWRGHLLPLRGALELGLTPVVYGDVVLDLAWGAAICSTEAILAFLIPRLKRQGFRVQRILWLGETDGILDQAGQTIPHIGAANYQQALRAIGRPAGTDVTGGMLLRLETARALSRSGIESWILNGTVPGVLAAALTRSAEAGGTRVSHG